MLKLHRSEEDTINKIDYRQYEYMYRDGANRCVLKSELTLEEQGIKKVFKIKPISTYTVPNIAVKIFKYIEKRKDNLDKLTKISQELKLHE